MSNDVIDGKAELVESSGPPPDASLVKEFVATWNDAVSGIRRVVVFGAFGLFVKSQCKHGEFKNWMEKNCPEIPYRTAAAFMQMTSGVLAALQLSDSLRIANLPLHKILSLSDAKASRKFKKGALKEAMAARLKIFELVDGKSQRQLLLEFRSEGKGQKHTPPNKSREERAEGKVRDAELAIKQLTGDIKTFCLGKSKTLALVKESTRNNLLDVGVAMNNRLRELQKGKNEKS